MAGNIKIKLNEYLQNIDNVLKTSLDSFHSPDAAFYPDFLSDIREITMNRVAQVFKCSEIELKMNRINELSNNSSTSYSNTLKNNVEKLIEQKNETNEIKSTTDKNDDTPDPLDELKGQRTLLSSLHIFGIPEELLKSEQIQTEIFKRLCKKLKAKVSDKEIEKTYAKKNALIVKLHRMDAKEKILDCAEDRDIWSNDLYELPKGHDPCRIKICHYMTPFYSKMWFTAEKFQNQGRLHSFKLTDKGLLVFRRHTSDERIFLSEQELVDYIKN